MLVISEKQYGAIALLVGQPTPFNKPQQFKQLMFLEKARRTILFGIVLLAL